MEKTTPEQQPNNEWAHLKFMATIGPTVTNNSEWLADSCCSTYITSVGRMMGYYLLGGETLPLVHYLSSPPLLHE